VEWRVLNGSSWPFGSWLTPDLISFHMETESDCQMYMEAFTGSKTGRILLVIYITVCRIISI